MGSRAFQTSLSLGLGLGMTGSAGAASAPVLWTPANLAVAPRVWANGDSAVFSGSNLSSWADGGSEAGSFTVGGTPTKQTLNALNGVRFDTAGQKLSQTIAAWGAGGKKFVFAIWAPRAATSTLYSIGVNSASSGANLITTFLDPGVESEYILNGFSGSPYVYSPADFSTVGTVYAGSWQAGATLAVFKNGTVQTLDGASLTGTVPNYTSQAWDFCEDWTGGVGNLDLFQALFFDYWPSTGERQQLEGWGLWRYGLQANLPVGHPYLLAAPTV